MKLIVNSGLRARDIVLNESAGDIVIVKAVVLAPNYVPKNEIELKKVLPFNVHALYNVYYWNTKINDLSRGDLLSHSDIIDRNKIDLNKVIGYFVKENNAVLEYRLMPNAREVLSSDQIEKVEYELKRLKW